MTAKDFHDQYRTLNVPLVDGQVIFKVDVHKYRNNSLTSDSFSTAHGLSAASKLMYNIQTRGKRLGATRWQVSFRSVAPPRPATPLEHLLSDLGFPGVLPKATLVNDTETVDTTEVHEVFVGKGLVSTVQQVLRLAAGFGIIAPTRAAMQSYCDANIGLDCSGFVGNYCRQEGIGKFGRETASGEFHQAGYSITDLKAIRANSIIVFAEDAHVTIVDKLEPMPGKTDQVQAWVAESTAAANSSGSSGLSYSKYTIKPKPPKCQHTGNFVVKRGVGNSGSDWYVWIDNY